MDKEPLVAMMERNAELKDQGKKRNEGVKLHLKGPPPELKELFMGEVHPNVQYEYESEGGGVYTLCVMLTDSAFSDEFPKVRTQVKFSSEFHRNRRIKKEQEKNNIFGEEDVNLVDGENEYGNFHRRT